MSAFVHFVVMGFIIICCKLFLNNVIFTQNSALFVCLKKNEYEKRVHIHVIKNMVLFIE